jgi:hypothetical protein
VSRRQKVFSLICAFFVAYGSLRLAFGHLDATATVLSVASVIAGLTNLVCTGLVVYRGRQR